MSLFIDLMATSSSELPFGVAWKRLRCISSGHSAHDYGIVEPIDKLRSENHPQNSKDYVYTVNVFECTNCTLIFLDKGFEQRLES